MQTHTLFSTWGSKPPTRSLPRSQLPHLSLPILPSSCHGDNLLKIHHLLSVTSLPWLPDTHSRKLKFKLHSPPGAKPRGPQQFPTSYSLASPLLLLPLPLFTWLRSPVFPSFSWLLSSLDTGCGPLPARALLDSCHLREGMEDYLEKGPSSGFSSHPYPLLAARITLTRMALVCPPANKWSMPWGWEGGALTVSVS